MRSHFSDEISETVQFQETAVQDYRRTERPVLPSHQPSSPPMQQPNKLGDLAAILALSIAFCTLLLLSQRSPVPPVATQLQSLELVARPIWVNNLPYGPRDGLVPDFGQHNR
jgi:hypothetical protein